MDTSWFYLPLLGIIIFEEEVRDTLLNTTIDSLAIAENTNQYQS
jgi:hypothetical protein